MGATRDKTTIKKNGVNIILDSIKGKNKITIFLLKKNIYAPEGSSPKESYIYLTEEKKVQDGNDKK